MAGILPSWISENIGASWGAVRGSFLGAHEGAVMLDGPRAATESTVRSVGQVWSRSHLLGNGDPYRSGSSVLREIQTENMTHGVGVPTSKRQVLTNIQHHIKKVLKKAEVQNQTKQNGLFDRGGDSSNQQLKLACLDRLAGIQLIQKEPANPENIFGLRAKFLNQWAPREKNPGETEIAYQREMSANAAKREVLIREDHPTCLGKLFSAIEAYEAELQVINNFRDESNQVLAGFQDPEAELYKALDAARTGSAALGIAAEMAALGVGVTLRAESAPKTLHDAVEAQQVVIQTQTLVMLRAIDTRRSAIEANPEQQLLVPKAARLQTEIDGVNAKLIPGRAERDKNLPRLKAAPEKIPERYVKIERLQAAIARLNPRRSTYNQDLEVHQAALESEIERVDQGFQQAIETGLLQASRPLNTAYTQHQHYKKEAEKVAQLMQNKASLNQQHSVLTADAPNPSQTTERAKILEAEKKTALDDLNKAQQALEENARNMRLAEFTYYHELHHKLVSTTNDNVAESSALCLGANHVQIVKDGFEQTKAALNLSESVNARPGAAPTFEGKNNQGLNGKFKSVQEFEMALNQFRLQKMKQKPSMKDYFSLQFGTERVPNHVDLSTPEKASKYLTGLKMAARSGNPNAAERKSAQNLLSRFNGMGSFSCDKPNQDGEASYNMKFATSELADEFRQFAGSQATGPQRTSGGPADNNMTEQQMQKMMEESSKINKNHP